MTARQVGFLVLLAVLVTAAAVGADAHVITPNEVTVNESTTFSFAGGGTAVTWCLVEAGDGLDEEQCSGSSRLTFTKPGTAWVRVTVLGDSGEETISERVTVRPADTD